MSTLSTSTRCNLARRVADSSAAQHILTSEAGVEWPAGHTPADVRVERVWPQRRSGISFEWSFDIGDGTRHSIYGAPDPSSPATEHRCSLQPVITPFGIRELFAPIPALGIRLQSLDKDPDLPHLAECLNESNLERLFATYWPNACDANSTADPMVTCNPLSYRPGRRAAIAYEWKSASKTVARMMGKTYRDDRGERLQARHARLNEQLMQASDGRIQTPMPLGYVPQQKTLFVEWADSQPKDLDVAGLFEVANAATEVLAVLHRTHLDDLPSFHAADELRVAERWWALLEMTDGRVCTELVPVMQALRSAASTLRQPEPTVIHRDFYERQLLITDESISVLDLDTLAYGDPCLDLGNLLAHLCLAAFVSGVDRQDLSTLASTALRSYAVHGGVLNRDALAFYWASALFRIGTIHFQRCATKRYAPWLWGIARGVLVLEDSPTGQLKEHTDIERIDIERVLSEAAL